MSNNLKPGDKFPDFQLPDHEGKQVSPSDFTRPSIVDQKLGFNDGYPLVVVFYRGFFCPRDQQQMHMLCEFQHELAVNFGRLIAISAWSSETQAAFRAGLGANWSFIADTERSLIKQLDILDNTEGEYAYQALPNTYVLKPDLTVYKVYEGWYFVGRPTLEELRQDLRSIMEEQSYYKHEAYTTNHAEQIRVPQQVWHDEEQRKAKHNTHSGVVKWFDKISGNGMITAEGIEEEIFFNFTAIPGEGYRTIRAGKKVTFELLETKTGKVAFRVIMK